MRLPATPSNALDVAIVVSYLLLTLLTGIIFRKRVLTSAQYFHAGRSLPTAITSVAFVAANCGSLEILGMVSMSAKYGALSLHFYWIGAIPAMLFLALFMMPVYVRSRALSVPEFLKLRYDERTRVLNAACFSIMMVLLSGIGLYAMAQVLYVVVGWSFAHSILVTGAVVLLYVWLGGLTATMYNEVFQFLVIIAGLFPLTYLLLRNSDRVWGSSGNLLSRVHVWQGIPLMQPAAPMDVIALVMGLGFILGCGYWCTDFVLIQRALAARTMEASMKTPVIAAVIKVVFPILVVVPGLAAGVLLPARLSGRYDLALPVIMKDYYGHGLLGLGTAAMLASVMSGLAGNVAALNSIWTQDLYRNYVGKNRSEAHYVFVGRLAAAVAVGLSIVSAYIAFRFESVMDYMQLLFSLFNAPIFAVFLLGMFTLRTTPKGGFWGLLAGTAAGMMHHAAYAAHWLQYGREMNANFYGAIYAFSAALATATIVSGFTERKEPESLQGVVWMGRLKSRPSLSWPFWALVVFVAILCLGLNVFFR